MDQVDRSTSIELALYLSTQYNGRDSGSKITLSQGLYSMSTSRLAAAGLNIAAEQFEERRPARKVVQQTYQGVYVDSYDVGPPVLTLLITAEMPQAAHLRVDFSEPIGALNQVDTRCSTSLSFIEMMDVMFKVSSERSQGLGVKVYYRDFGRRVHHEVSILSVSPRGAVARQNMLTYQVIMVAIRPDLMFNQAVRTNPTNANL